MFEAGQLIYRIQTTGAQAFRAEMQAADDVAKKTAKSVDESAKSTKKLGSESDSTAPKIRSMRSEILGMSDEAQRSATLVGSSMLGIGAAIIAVTALTVKAAVDWESAWAGVTKTVDGTDAELSTLQAGLRGLASELPAAHSEIAAVAEAAGQLGVQTGNVVAFTKTMIDLGETTNLSAQTAATELARFMNVMGTSQDRVSNLGSAIVALGNNYATTEAEIVSMAQRLSGAGRQVGLSEGEVLGLSTALSSVGIEAEAGGSAFSKVMVDIASSVATGGSQLETYSRVAGISAEEFVTAWRTEPARAMALFVKGLANAESQGQSTFAVLEELGITEVRMRDALLRSSAAADQFAEAMATGNVAIEENTALQSEAAKRYETTASQLAIMRNNINDVAIDMGAVFLPMVVQSAEAVSEFTRFLAEMPDSMQQGIAVTALLVGGLIAFRGALLVAIPKIVEFRVAMAALSTEMPIAANRLKGVASILGGPWGIALAAAAGGTMILVTEIEKLLVSADELTGRLKSADDAADSFNAAMGRKFINPSFDTSNELLEKLNDALIDARANWTNWMDTISFENQPVLDVVRDFGRGLADLAATDLPAAQRQFELLAEKTDGTHAQLWALLSNMPEYRDALMEQAAALGVNVTSENEAANQRNLLRIATVENTIVTEDATEAYLAAADQATDLKSRLEDLISTILESNDVGMDAISANTDYAATLDTVKARIAEVQAGAEGYEVGISDATEATRANREALVDQARDAQDAASKTFELTSNWTAYKTELQNGRQTLIDNAIALGATQEEAQALADTIFSIPEQSEWELIANTMPAVNAINGVIASFNGRQITLRVSADGSRSYNVGGTPLTYFADGAVRPAADGYVEPMSHQRAQMRRGGSYVLWAEDETQGESFIPHAPSKRPESERLMMQTADIFGGTYIPGGSAVRAMAEGAVRSSATVRGEMATLGDASQPIELADSTIRKLADAVVRTDRRRTRMGDV